MMRRMITRPLCAFALGVMSATPALAAQSMTSSAEAPASNDAVALAALMIPYDLFLQTNIDSFMFGFDETVKSDAQAIALFDAYPGIREAIVTAQIDSLKMVMAREHIVLMDRIGRLNQRSYTAPELVKLNTFFGSAIGRKLIASEFKTVDRRKLLEALSGDDVTLTKQETAEIAKGAPQRIFESLTKAEQVESLRFWGSTLGQKVNGNGPKVQEITRDWLNALNVTNVKNAEALTQKVVREFIEKSEAGS